MKRIVENWNRFLLSEEAEAQHCFDTSRIEAGPERLMCMATNLKMNHKKLFEAYDGKRPGPEKYLPTGRQPGKRSPGPDPIKGASRETRNLAEQLHKRFKDDPLWLIVMAIEKTRGFHRPTRGQ